MASQHDTILRAVDTLVDELTDYRERLPRALSVLADSTGPLRGTDPSGGSGGGTGGHSDPTAAVAGRRDSARDSQRRVNSLMRDMLQASRRLGAILNEYNPPARLQAELRGSSITNEEIWCVNHRAHGHNEPRGQGRSNCRWCDDTKSKHGRLPTAALIDAKSRRTLNEGDYKRLLK